MFVVLFVSSVLFGMDGWMTVLTLLRSVSDDSLATVDVVNAFSYTHVLQIGFFFL